MSLAESGGVWQTPPEYVGQCKVLDEEEADNGPDMDDEDEEEEHDPLGALDVGERDNLIKNTEVVRTTLIKVCLCTSIISLPFSCLLLL